MAITEAYANSASISTTEYSLPANSTSLATLTNAGIFQLLLDLNALTATEQYRLKIYEKVQSSGTKRVIQTVEFTGIQDEPIYVTPSLILINGWDITMIKLFGTSRTIEWSIRKVA